MLLTGRSFPITYYIFDVSMNIKKNNVFIYPIDKVVFPYHEYAFSITSNLYERTHGLT